RRRSAFGAASCRASDDVIEVSGAPVRRGRYEQTRSRHCIEIATARDRSYHGSQGALARLSLVLRLFAAARFRVVARPPGAGPWLRCVGAFASRWKISPAAVSTAEV